MGDIIKCCFMIFMDLDIEDLRSGAFLHCSFILVTGTCVQVCTYVCVYVLSVTCKSDTMEPLVGKEKRFMQLEA